VEYRTGGSFFTNFFIKTKLGLIVALNERYNHAYKTYASQRHVFLFCRYICCVAHEWV